jgi:hypothetical protein
MMLMRLMVVLPVVHLLQVGPVLVAQVNAQFVEMEIDSQTKYVMMVMMMGLAVSRDVEALRQDTRVHISLMEYQLATLFLEMDTFEDWKLVMIITRHR